MTVLCAPDKFRGSLTAAEAAAAMAAGARDAGLDAVELPLADGGEGTLDVLLAACGGDRRHSRVSGPDGNPVTAAWGLLADGTAVLELAQASGLALAGAQNDPIGATTRGTGELIAAAAAAGATRAILGVGGSATTDGGLGAIEAVDGELPLPVVVACDVTTTFLDAATVFAPQKGANAEQVALLAGRLDRLAERYRLEHGVDVTRIPGSGAAGGTAGGLAALGAELRPGFEVVADACGLPTALAGASVVVTGEGRVDATSLDGKVVGGVLSAARAAGTPAVVVAGEIVVALGARTLALVDLEPDGETFGRAAELVRLATLRLLAEPQ